MMPTPKQIVALLRQKLHHSIRGQPDVLLPLCLALARRIYNAVPQRGARGCFFFAGPTGVGKTETAKLIAEVLGGEEGFLRVDCAEYKTLASLEGLLGDHAHNRGRLGRAYDRCPRGVWLWDEIEKAHPELVQLFLQMGSAARLTLGCGDTLDLSNIILIVTSNLGSAELLGLEHLSLTSQERHVVACIRNFLRPELLARFGRPYVFRPLGREAQAEIAALQLEELLLWQLEQGRQIECHPEVLPFLIHRGFSRDFGARALRDFIDATVGDAITEQLEAGATGSGQLVVRGNRLAILP